MIESCKLFLTKNFKMQDSPMSLPNKKLKVISLIILAGWLILMAYPTIILCQNNSLHFDGVDDYVLGPNSQKLELAVGTVELWIKPEFQSSKQTFLCYRSLNGALTRYLWNFLENISGLGFWNGETYQTISHTFSPGIWHHLAFVDNNLQTLVYVNGSKVGAFASQFGSASGESLRLVLGVDAPGTEYFAGEIDQIRIWSYPFCAADVLENMGCSLSSNKINLQLYYPFNQGDAQASNLDSTVLIDITANALDGSLKNFSLTGTISNWITSGVALSNCDPESICNNPDILEIKRDCWPYDYPDTLSYFETWHGKLQVDGINGHGSFALPQDSIIWCVGDTSIATIDSTGSLQAKKAGLAFAIVKYKTLSDSIILRVHAPIRAPEIGPIENYLASINYEFIIQEMPVIIIRYLPTSDGVNLDVSHAPDFFALGHTSLSNLKSDIDVFDKRVKFSVQEGTRFRDYGRNMEIPYLGYKVVEYITVYEPTPRGKQLTVDDNGFPVYAIDYHSLFERFNLKDYINNQGVKEIWIWSYGHDSEVPSFDPTIHQPCNFRFWWESNMSSPTTGDISNSDRDNSDLPIYNNTYIVYNQNFRRTQAEAVHNRGHQFESMFSIVNEMQLGNDDLFWNDFVGRDMNQFITGRCGWTHMPPNTTTDYDYENANVVLSDIEDWTPAHDGSTTSVSNSTWQNLEYSWPEENQTFPQKTESNWYIYWMQSFPGFLNDIDYQSSHRMSNWWQIIHDWDNSFLAGKGLVEEKCFTNLSIPQPLLSGRYNKEGLISTSMTVPPKQMVQITSDQSIRLEAFSEIHQGSILEIAIKECNSPNSRIAPNDLRSFTNKANRNYQHVCSRHCGSCTK